MIRELHPHAAHAIRAAANYDVWGSYATMRYCRRHGVPLSLLTTARILRTATEAGL